jgi:RNA polymerase sigma-70 factor (ECF subfamily)
MPRGDQLGVFELQVLLTLERLGADAYGMAVRRELEGRAGRQVSIGAVYATLDRLEVKGYISSRAAPGPPERRGRARRYFGVEQAGRRAVEETLAAIDLMRQPVSGDAPDRSPADVKVPRKGARASSIDGLFARAQSGDQEAWEELFLQCYPRVVRVVRRRLSQPMRSLYAPADFAADVWRSLVANSDRFDFPTVAALMAFLEKAATQKVIDEHRRLQSLKRDQRRTTSLDADPVGPGPGLPLASTDPTPSQYAGANEGWQRVSERLDETHRRVLEMTRQGYSTREIAEAVGWHVRKVQRVLKELGDVWLSDDGRQP